MLVHSSTLGIPAIARELALDARTLSWFPLATVIGYDLTAELVAEALRTGRSIREVAHSHAVLPEAELRRLLDVNRMTGE